MTDENKVRIFNRLFFKLYVNYAVMIAVAASLIGFIFYELYAQTMTENNKIELQQRASSISQKARDDIINNRQDDYRQFVYDFAEINGWDIWTISNPDADQPMGERMETGDSYDEIAATEGYAQYVPLINAAFSGRSDFDSNSYDEIYQAPTIFASAPIVVNNEVVGAVLIIQQQDVLGEMLSNSLSLIVVSIVVALGISFVIVIVFATKLSVPISRMRVTALELAAGNYNSKTGITRNDEIGDLAKTVDILSEKLLENETMRKKLDQMRLDFFANVSHELRTPITVIRAYTEALSDGVVQEKEQAGQYYDRMLSECKSMERLVGDLLILSKMQNPDFKIEKEPVNLQQVFEDIIRSAGAIAQKKSIKIEVVSDEPGSMVLGDYDRLRQMFMVILDNAIKFSEENKTVHIKMTREDKIKVSIRDEGVGIEASDIPYIFEKFYKSNLRQNASGTGLGLAIAKQIAIKHDGTVEVESTPGVGTQFVFTFPPFTMEEAAVACE
jgi:signal transduction histidine kinase